LSGRGAQPLMSSGFIVAGCAVSVVAGVAVYFLIERPLVAACKSSLGKRRRQLAQPA
jgi:exopolysaccharide production protein ExoZ